MQLDSIRRDRRGVALLAAPAFALALAACGGGSGEVSSSDAAEAPAATIQQAESNTTETTAADSPDSEESTSTGEVAADTTDTADAPGSTGASIVLLDADEAIANAELNQPTLQVVDNVLDIETLAVGDGSVQTLRQVVDGDRPVLLWFYAPH